MAMLSQPQSGTVRHRLAVLGGAATQAVILTALFSGMASPAPPPEPLTIELATIPPPPQAEPPAEAPPEPPMAAVAPPEPAPPETETPPPVVLPPPDVPPPPELVTPAEVSPAPAVKAEVPVPTRPPPPRPAVHRPRPPAAVATAVPAQAVPAATTAAPPAASGTAPAEHHAEETLRGHIRDAVQQAVRCPAAASLMGLSGKAAVAFDYRDGALLADAQLTRSAGASMLDSAALAAVRNARYPKPPPGEAGHTLRLLIWVEEACADR
nr:energy transducer TonB [uncultured Rhodopila sp.]